MFEHIRYAVRQFRLAPAFTTAAVLTLALGIGGTTAIFTLIDAVMLKSLPVKDPSGLYRIGTGDNCCVQGGPQDQWGFFSYPLVQLLTSQAPEFVVPPSLALPHRKRCATGVNPGCVGRGHTEFAARSFLLSAQ